MPTLLRARSNYRAKPLAKLPTLVIGQNTAGYQYVLASPRGSQWNIESFGPLELKPVEPEPAEAETTGNATTAQDLQTSTRNWTELLQNPWQSLSPAQIKNRRVVLCLQRPDMEFCSFPLMLDPAEDPTMLIHNELEVQEHWSKEEMTIDFYRQDLDGDQPQVFAAATATENLEQWSELCKERNLKLEQVFARPLATIALLDNIETEALDGSCLLLAVYGQQADLILLHQRKPAFIRSLFLQNPESVGAAVEQLIAEIRLSISTIDLPYLDDALGNSLVVADRDLATELIIQLKVELDIAGTRVDLEDLETYSFAEEMVPDIAITPLLGALQLETRTPGKESLDLMNPKQPVEPPSMVSRILLLSALLIVVLGYFGMNWYDQYQANREAMVKVVASARKDKKAFEAALPDARISKAVKQWQQQEIQWLKQLEALTESLPSGDQAVIRQFRGDQTPEGASVSMQIQVSDLNVSRKIVDTLENSSLEIKLRRVVETNDPRYPFRLETTLVAPRVATGNNAEDVPADPS